MLILPVFLDPWSIFSEVVLMGPIKAQFPVFLRNVYIVFPKGQSNKPNIIDNNNNKVINFKQNFLVI